MLTQTEMNIIAREYEHQEHLSSEMVSNKSFVGGMAAIAAFVTWEWLKLGPNPALAVVIVTILLAAGGIFLWLCWGQDYVFPADPEEWVDWRSRWSQELRMDGDTDSSDTDLAEAYWQRVMATAARNRTLNRRAQTAVLWAGTLSVLAVLSILVDAIARAISS